MKNDLHNNVDKYSLNDTKNSDEKSNVTASKKSEVNEKQVSNNDAIVFYKYDDNGAEHIAYQDGNDSSVENTNINNNQESINVENNNIDDNQESSNVENNNIDNNQEYEEVEYEEVIIDDGQNLSYSSDSNNNISSDEESLEDALVLTENAESDEVILGDDNISNDNVLNNDSDKKEHHSVFTDEERASLASDEILQKQAKSLTNVGNGTVQDINQESNFLEKQLSSNNQSNFNQIVSNQSLDYNSSNQNYGNLINCGVQVYPNQAVTNQIPPGQIPVPLMTQGQSFVSQYQIPNAVNMNQGNFQYSVQNTGNYNANNININRSGNFPNNVLQYSSQGNINQPYLNANQGLMGMYQTSNLNGGINSSNMAVGQQAFGQVNAPTMYQASSATYATRGMQSVNQVPYNNTSAAQMGSVRASAPIINQNLSTNTRNNTNIDKKIYKKKSGIVKFIFEILLLAIVCFIAYVMFFRKSNYTGNANLNFIFNPFKPIVVYKDGKAGYVDFNGKSIIEPTYDFATEFYGEYAAVSLNEEYKIINKAGETVVSVKNKIAPVYDVEYSVWIIDDCLYNESMEKLASNVKSVGYGIYSYVNSSSEKVGVVNYLGETLYFASGTSIEVGVSQSYNYDVYALVHVPNMEDVIVSNKEKKVVYKSASNNISDYGNAIFSDRTGDVVKFLYFRDGKVHKEFTDAIDVNMFNFNAGILQVKTVNSMYYYDSINNTELSEIDSKNLVDFDEKYYGYTKTICGDEPNFKYGLMKDDNDIFNCEYDDISFLDIKVHEFIKSKIFRKYVILTKNDEVVLYDLLLKKNILEMNNVSLVNNSQSMFLVFEANDNSTTKEDVIYNLITGKILRFSNSNNRYIAKSNNLVVLDDNNTATYYNIFMKEIYKASNYPL